MQRDNRMMLRSAAVAIGALAVKIGYRAASRLSLHAGYRMVEGGADVPATYTFAWLHSAVAGVRWRL